MKFDLTFQEWFPVLILVLPDGGLGGGDTAEFSEAEIADMKRVSAEFVTWQKRIASRFGETWTVAESMVDDYDYNKSEVPPPNKGET